MYNVNKVQQLAANLEYPRNVNLKVFPSFSAVLTQLEERGYALRALYGTFGKFEEEGRVDLLVVRGFVHILNHNNLTSSYI